MSDLNRRLALLEGQRREAQPAYRPLTPDEVEIVAAAVIAAEKAYMKAVEEGRGETALQEAEASYLRTSKVDSLRCFPDGDIGRVITAMEAIWLREKAK
jgi:hypothetical protein